MNKRCDTRIYSQTSNQNLALKKQNNTSSRTPVFTMQSIAVKILSALGLASFTTATIAAGVVADANLPIAEQAVILPTHGAPQIQINTPSAAGISVNQFSQFDVDTKGVVLANNRLPAQTQLAGWVEANPKLIRGEASAIVNQVNSAQPSQLNGYIEVAGKRADVFIANPAGISINGAGFLNASSAILTTGNLHLTPQGIKHIDVQQGNIRVEGKGLDSSQTDYTALIARSVEIQGNIYQGKGQLDIITGQNIVQPDGQVQKSASAHSENTPQIAIDSSALGGMYADKIRLLATEAGLGVNNAGQIHTQQLTLSADGTLSNQGTIHSQTQQINAQALNNQGSIAATENQTISINVLENHSLVFCC